MSIRFLRRCLPIAVASAFALSVALVPTVGAAKPDKSPQRAANSLVPLPPAAAPGKIQPLHPVPIPRPGQKVSPNGRVAPQQAPTTCPSPTIDQKVLVLSADGGEADLADIQSALDYVGVPYTTYVGSWSPGGLTSTSLASGCHAFYNGIITTSGDLGTAATGVWQSALSETEWQTLWSYAAQFNVRQISWYTFPIDLYGFAPQNGSASPDSTTPYNATLTAAGKPVFAEVNANNPIPISWAYVYLARPLDASTSVLMSDSSGNALMASRVSSDGRETLALTFDSNPNLQHSLTLNYGLVNWVTRGLFLGERHIFATPQLDDLFIADAEWLPTTACSLSGDDPSLPDYRNSATDVTALKAWQTSKQASYPAFRLALAYNASGASNGDALTKSILQNQTSFNFINHTWDHENLDALTYSDASAEFSQDISYANGKFTNFSKQNLVTPDVSGLYNAQAMRAAYDQGIRFVVGDTSKSDQANPSPNAGIYNALVPGILEIPRRPVNLYFNATTPQEWLAEDNCLYGPNGKFGTYGGVTTYAQLLDRVSGDLLPNMLRGDMDPWMFHVANLRAYDKTHSLLGDLVDRLFSRYQAVFTLPVISTTQDDLGARFAARMAYNSAGVTASRTGNTLTITAKRAATVPVTGLRISGSELYGGQYIAHVKLLAGQTLSYTVQ
jgi:hypothetical protein